MMMKNEKLSNEESLALSLQVKELQVKSLLTITQAINDNVSSEGLFNMYKNFLSWEMGIHKMALLIPNIDSWTLAAQINSINTDVEKLLPLLTEHRRLYTIKPTDDPILKQFDIIIPVSHKDKLIAYSLIGGIKEKREIYSKIQFITTITNVIALAIENKTLYRNNSAFKESINENIKSGVLELKGLMVLQTAFLQYWTFFDDYISTTKDKCVNYQVIKHPKGLEISVEVTEELTESLIEEYLNEYSNFLLETKINVRGNFEREVLEKEIELLNLQMREQKHNFERQIDILETTNKILQSDKTRFLGLLESAKNQPIVLHINQQQSQQQSQQQNQISIIDFKYALFDLLNNIEMNAPHLLDDTKEGKEILDELEVVIASANGENHLPKQLENKLITYFNNLLSKIKDAKTVLVDTPKVVLTLLDLSKALISTFGTTGDHLIKLKVVLSHIVKTLSSYL